MKKNTKNTNIPAAEQALFDQWRIETFPRKNWDNIPHFVQSKYWRCPEVYSRAREAGKPHNEAMFEVIAEYDSAKRDWVAFLSGPAGLLGLAIGITIDFTTHPSEGAGYGIIAGTTFGSMLFVLAVGELCNWYQKTQEVEAQKVAVQQSGGKNLDSRFFTFPVAGKQGVSTPSSKMEYRGVELGSSS